VTFREAATGGMFAVFKADSVMVSSGADTDGSDGKREFVALIAEFANNDLDKPVGRMLYRASPEGARAIALALLREADLVERDVGDL